MRCSNKSVRSNDLLHRLLKNQVNLIASVIMAINFGVLAYTAMVSIVAADEASQKYIQTQAGGAR